MLPMKLTKAYLCVALLALAQCGSPKEQAPQGVVVPNDKQLLQDVNRYLSEKEQDILSGYVARQHLDMHQSSSGYYYQLVEQGRGAVIANGDVVRLHGRIFLIDGTPCYAYDAQHPLELRLGVYPDIKILNTALLGVKEGSKLRFVFPSHMAYGLMGDGNKIPPRSPLVCELVVVKVEKR